MTKKKIHKKIPIDKISQSHENDFVAWRFSSIDKEGEFAWPDIPATVNEIHKTLYDYDSMTWSEVKSKQCHSISTQNLSDSAKKRLETIGKADAEKLFSFRVNAKARIIAIRDNNVAKLLWWDPEHQVCPSVLKHT